MIDINDADIVTTRHTADGRFVIFTSTDVQPGWPLRWWTAVADTGGDGLGIPVRLDAAAAPAGWTARQLLTVAHARMVAENERLSREIAMAAIASLDLAVAGGWGQVELMARDDPVAFAAGGEASPYAWTVARCGPFHLPLCPDPENRGEGVTPEQLLIILDQLLHDACRAFPHARPLWACRRHVAAALKAEAQRVVAVRGDGRSTTASD
jgi:hypothetical protein